ncbi:conjugal transfer protein TraO [Chryseobacterium cucumeris]|uniref:conjugal transfer protein TraO n=1 Tax=Chryseobacterium cucumeris TaxID=1813611 RepID=UPI001E43E782
MPLTLSNVAGSIVGKSVTDNFVYGVGGKISFESYLTRHWVFIINGQLRFFRNSQQG